MGKPKKSEVQSRPSLPTLKEIVADVTGASSDDPVFTEFQDFDFNKIEKNEMMETDEDIHEISENYSKVCELMNMLSSMRNGKDHLENICHQLLGSKEDVSAVALQLKTRLDKQRLISSRLMEK